MAVKKSPTRTKKTTRNLLSAKTATKKNSSKIQKKSKTARTSSFSLRKVWVVTNAVFAAVVLVGLLNFVSTNQSEITNDAAAQAIGSTLTYLDDGKSALVSGQSRTLTTDIRGSGTITPLKDGVKYTSQSGERSEHAINGASKPLWPDNSSGWFAFDFTVHDTDSSWRLIEQEHEGDMSPSRALEASQDIKLVARYGTPHTRGPDRSWSAGRLVPGQRVQVVGYEKFGQGNAVLQAWIRPYGQSEWKQFANSSGFSMGYTSGNPGRYHKRGTYHGNHGEVSSVTWYGTALMYANRAAAEAAAGINGGSSSPTPTPTPEPTPTPTPTPTPPPPSPGGNPEVPVPTPGSEAILEAGDASACTTLGKAIQCKLLAQTDPLAANGYGLQLNHQNDSVSHTFNVQNNGTYRIGAYLRSQSYRGNAKIDMHVDGSKVNPKPFEIRFTDKYNYYFVQRSLSAGNHTIKITYINDKCGNSLFPNEKCKSDVTDRDLWVDRIRLIHQ